MDSEPTIAETAGLCFSAFQQCLEKSAFISPREMSRVEDQFARFSLWTANIGVFASGRASLDHRLREAQEVHEVITGLLEVLDDKIKECTSYLKSFIEPEGDDAHELDQEKLDKQIQGLASQITLLHRLSNTIRKANSETQNAKAANTFKILDDEGNDVEPLLEIIFANYVRDKFRSIDEEILQRLVRAMVTRRKRVLYKRSRFGNLALRVKETKPRPKVQAPQTQPQQTPATQELPQAENKEDDIGANYKSQAGVSATTLAVDKFKKASAPSVISGTKTVAFDNHEDLPFPLPPLGRVRRKYKKMKWALEENLASIPEGYKADSLIYPERIEEVESKLLKKMNDECWDQCLRAVGEVTCPFCFYAISALDISDDNKWRSHVRNDLDAYICLFERCNDQDKLFGHSEEWLRHMREHALRWPCNSKSHGHIIFDSRDEYISHLKEAHKNTFSDPQLRVLADRNARTIGPLFKSCPFCGFDDTSSGTKIEDHIVGHLRFLALKSLPPYEDERSESSDAESTSSRASKPRKRSTIENDPDKQVKTDFEDNGPIVLLDSGDESVVEPVSTSLYIPRRRNMEWGFVTETFDEIVNVDDDTILQHIAAKQAHQSNVGWNISPEDIKHFRKKFLEPHSLDMLDEQIESFIVKYKRKLWTGMLHDEESCDPSTIKLSETDDDRFRFELKKMMDQDLRRQRRVGSPENTGTPSSPASQLNQPSPFKINVRRKKTAKWVDAKTYYYGSDDRGDGYHGDADDDQVDEVPSELNTSKKLGGARFHSYEGDGWGDEYYEEEEGEAEEELPAQDTSRFTPAAPDSKIVLGEDQDERSSDKGKHRIIEVTTEGSSGSQFLSVPGTGTEITPGSQTYTLPRPTESRSLRSLSEGLPSLKDFWDAPHQRHDGNNQEDYIITDKEPRLSRVSLIDTGGPRSWLKRTSEELRNESPLRMADMVAASTAPERRRDAHSPGARLIEKMSLKQGNKDNTPVVERREVDHISETSITGKVPDVVPRQDIAGTSILVNPDVASQETKVPNLDDAVLDDMIQRLLASCGSSSKTLCIHNEEITTLCAVSREVFLSQPVLLELKAPVKIVGDIHGQYTDMLRMFELSGYPPNENYLFLGDYVDRGKSGLETILLLLCYKLKYPENFFLLRGNHECANVTRVYGFYDECKRRCNIKMWKTFVDVFNCLPVAAIVSDKIFCVHGGLSPSLGHMNDVRAIVRPTDIPDHGLLTDLLWSDPALMEQDWEANERGVSYTFGKHVIRESLARFDFDLICRAHMVVEDGYEFYEDRVLVTIFTAPNYCGEFDNWGAIMSVSEDLLCSFELLKPLSAPIKTHLKTSKSLTESLRDTWKKWTAPSGK